MRQSRDIYCVHCPATGGMRRLSWPLQLLIRRGGELGLAGTIGLLLTLIFWLSSMKAPLVRQCSASLLRAMAAGKQPLSSCATAASRQPKGDWLPPALGQPLTQPPNPSVLRRDPSGD
jgi:hypothetical protein